LRTPLLARHVPRLASLQPGQALLPDPPDIALYEVRVPVADIGFQDSHFVVFWNSSRQAEAH
jgi:hypothetical protein